MASLALAMISSSVNPWDFIAKEPVTLPYDFSPQGDVDNDLIKELETPISYPLSVFLKQF